MDGGASRHMTGYKSTLTDFWKKPFTVQVELGNDASYEIKGVGSTSFLLDSSTILHINDILYVSGLKRNLLSVGVLEDKGYEVIFKQGKTYLWDKDKDLDSIEVIGVHEGLYKVPGQKIQALAHSTVTTRELWHRRLGHLHYKALPDLQKIVSGNALYFYF